MATPIWARVLVWLIVPLLGAGLLLGLDRLIDVVLRLDWVPWRGAMELVQRVPEPWDTVGPLVLGLVLGLVLAGLVDAESLTVRVGLGEVELTRPGVRKVVPLAEVATAFLEKDKLVLLGRTGREMAREPCHLSAGRLEPALRGHGIAWAERDPYEDAYRRWIPDSPEVPQAAGAVFAARQRALDKGDEGDAAELREELAGHGYVVRDKRKKQYWRQVS